MRRGSFEKLVRIRAIAVAVFLVVAFFGFRSPRLISTATGIETQVERQHARRRERGVSLGRTRKPSIDYSKFSHQTPQHRRECSECHRFPSPNWNRVRKGKDAFQDVTDYPQHPSCINCHMQQFFARERPAPMICSVCHIAVTPFNGTRYPFPNQNAAFLASHRGQSFVSDFQIEFPHQTHVDVVSLNRHDLETGCQAKLINISAKEQQSAQGKQTAPKGSESCVICHQTYQPQGTSDDEYSTPRPRNLSEDAFWLRKGTFETTPDGHTLCFTCHSPGGEIRPASSECNACHKLLPIKEGLPVAPRHADFDPKLAAAMRVSDLTILDKWRRRQSSGTFRHENGEHINLNCTDCHNPAEINTIDKGTLKVPVPACGGKSTGCHIEATTDGILNYEIDKRRIDQAFQCTKCHVTFGGEPIPESHIKAIPISTPK